MQAKLHLLPNTLSTCYPDEYTLICMRPCTDKCKIQIKSYLSVGLDSSFKAIHNGERLLNSHVNLCDIRLIFLFRDQPALTRRIIPLFQIMHLIFSYLPTVRVQRFRGFSSLVQASRDFPVRPATPAQLVLLALRKLRTLGVCTRAFALM